MKTCPKCRLASPDDAESCDCGYSFDTGRVGQRRKLNVRSSGDECLASVGDRVAAHVIDGAIGLGLFGLFAGIGLAVGPRASVLAGVGYVVGISYVLLADGLRTGQGFGKRAMKIRVVDAASGKPCGLLQAVGRKVMLVLGPLDWLFIFGRQRQRLGDHFARTRVVIA